MTQFPSCGPNPIGLYPIVENSDWILRLAKCGVSCFQLRIKNQPYAYIQNEIIKSIVIAKENNIRLFINDYWQLAIDYGAYGVHLGMEDIQTCDIEQLRRSGLRLGISTHSHNEMDFALQFNPSYVACGPLFPTQSKAMPYVPQGIERLTHWVKTLDIPVVAIGGINLGRMPEVIATGVDGIALISAITQSSDPEQTTRSFLNLIK